MEFYRSFPKTVQNPKNYPILTKEQFDNMQKVKMQEANSVCKGHVGTIVWHADDGYVVQVSIKGGKDIFVSTPCTIKPQFGIDSFDGMLIEDAEKFVLKNETGEFFNGLLVFDGKEDVDITDYLMLRGIKASKKVKKKWWELWK